jgi:hypothetical protein
LASTTRIGSSTLARLPVLTYVSFMCENKGRPAELLKATPP